MGLRDELLPAFIEAVAVALREMAEVEACPREGGPGPAADLWAVLHLTDGPGGRVAFGFPAGTAAALARRILRDVPGTPDDGMVRDCMGEVGNVVAGQAKTMLFGTPYHFVFSLPAVGPTLPPAPGRGEVLAVGFDSDAGPFTLRLEPAA